MEPIKTVNITSCGWCRLAFQDYLFLRTVKNGWGYRIQKVGDALQQVCRLKVWKVYSNCRVNKHFWLFPQIKVVIIVTWQLKAISKANVCLSVSMCIKWPDFQFDYGSFSIVYPIHFSNKKDPWIHVNVSLGYQMVRKALLLRMHRQVIFSILLHRL